MIPRRLVVATHNPEKRAEWLERLLPLGVEVVDRELPEVVEDARDYEGNARKKALSAARATGLPALGDDVGLEVDALEGRPGLETRRWAEALGGWSAARAALARIGGSGATFRCAVALAWPDGRATSALGSVRGTVVAPRGQGPALEPCFVPEGEERTLSELSPAQRDRVHHRARALAALAAGEGEQAQQ